MARATAGSVSIQSVPDGVSGESVQLAVDITKGNALYDFVECVWTTDDGTIVDTTSARVISFWALGATPPAAPTNVTTWNFAGNATWTRGGAQPSPTATLNVYKAIRIEHFDGIAPSAATFVSASWGDGVTKVADAVPVITERTRTIYRLSTTTPSAPAGGTSTAAFIPAGWQAGPQPAATATQNVYSAQRTETFSNGVFTSATVYGSVTKVGDKVAPTANTQTITLPSSAFTRNEFGNRWAFSTTSRTTNPSIIQALRPNATEVYFHSLYIWKDGRVQLEFNYDLSVGDSRADLTTTFEATGGFTLTAGNNTLVVALNGADTSEPYLWTPSNSDDVTAFYNAVTTATEATLVLTDNIMAVPVTTTRTRFIYTLATSLPSAPAGGTTTAAYIPSGWQATEPDPTSTQAVYRATRTETFTNGVFTSATVYGSVTKVADKVFVPADFDLASGNGTADGLTTDGTYLYISNDDDNHVYVYTLAGARQSTREFDLHNDNTISAGITTDGTYLYVVDRSDDHVYVYTLAGARQSTREFNLHNDNGNSFGITTDGTYLYVVDIVDDHVYVYTLAGARQSTREFNLHNDNGGPQGITTDGTYLYVVDQPDNHVYVYTLAGARQSTREFDLRNALVSRAAGITTHGTYFYVADNSADKIFVYPMS